MALTPGTRLGPYTIAGSIGAGGMGEVYRATDTNLDRQVAIKVLPEAFAHDSERLARFEREAKTLAALNHPHIAQIYGLEKSDPSTSAGQAAVMALVMELVEGEDLSQRIARGPIPLDEALPIARQIAEALEAAHEQGIIHRDLKPANIKVTTQGDVKVLDFGLAKLVETATTPGSADGAAAISLSPTITSAGMMTGVGVLLGTAAYMSPEQAKGRAADRRSDLWAFGCVLFEMLTGRPVFDGGDVTDVLVGVLSKEPEWSALPASVPPSIRTLVRRCLQKDRTQRLQSAGDARIEIQDAQSLPEMQPGAQGQPGSASGRRVAIVAMSGLVVGVVVAGLAVWTLKPAPLQGLIHLAVPLPLGDRMLPFTPALTVSPDSSRIAFSSMRSGARQIFVRSLDSADAKAIPGTEGGDSPFFSPDGQWLGFVAGGNLMKVSMSGGAPFAICPAPDTLGVSWGDNDTIAFAPTYGVNGLSVVAAAGGKPQSLTSRGGASDEAHRWPQLLPGGKAVLFTAWTRNINDAQIVVQRLDTRERTVVVHGGTYGRYVDTGHLIYNRAGALVAVRFDLSRLEAVGSPIPVTQGVSMTPEGAGQYDVSPTGTFVYVPGNVESNLRTLVWLDRTGKETALDAPPRSYASPSLSPDGQRIAVHVAGVNDDIWIYDIPRRTLSRLTVESRSLRPIWTPDGKRVIYRSVRDGRLNLFARNADGSGNEERLTVSDLFQTPNSVSPDGRTLVFSVQGPDLWLLSLADKAAPRTFLQSPFRETNATFSPDSQWLAYQSDESGRNEIYAQPLPNGGAKMQISRDGGETPIWTRSGELFYRQGTKVIVVRITTRPSFAVGSPDVAADGPQYAPANYLFDVSADGRRLLMIKENDQSTSATQINVVLNWTRELMRQVPH